MTKKRILLIVLAVITLLSSTVSAAEFDVSQGVTTPAPPVIPDPSTVEIENNIITSGSLPQKVTTVMQPVSTSGSAITMVTADKYYFYTPQNGQAAHKFMAEFEGMTNEIFNGRCYFKVVNANSLTPGAFIEKGIGTNTEQNFLYLEDISSVLSEGQNSSTVYISIIEKNTNPESPDILKYGPVAVNVNYSADKAHLNDQNKLFRPDFNYLYVDLNVPGDLSNSTIADFSLVGSNGNIVAKTINGIGGIYKNHISNLVDNRYALVFENYTSLCMDSTLICTTLYRASEIPQDSYGVSLTLNGEPTVYPDIISVVDMPLVKGAYTAVSDGFSPPVVGGNQAYVCATIEDGKIDDYFVSIVDSNNTEVGRSVAGKYFGEETIMYKVILNEGKTFQVNETYSIKLNDKSGTLFYTIAPLDVYNQFSVYDYNFCGEGLSAAFNLRAVNIPAEANTVELGLFTLNDELIASAMVTPAGEMENVQFLDKNTGALATLEQFNSYQLKVKRADSSWEEDGLTIRAERYINIVNEQIPFIQVDSLPYIYVDQSTYNFDVLLPKYINEITDSTEFHISLKDENNAIVGDQNGSLVIDRNSTIEYWMNGQQSASAVKLSGQLSLAPGALSEGIYYLTADVIGTDEASSCTISYEMYILSRDKIFATSSYPMIEVTDTGYKLSGYAGMLKIDQAYDSSKFTYELTDLLGKPIGIGPMEVTHEDFGLSYEDYYRIIAPVAEDIPAAYYYLKIKYDGKDIYDLSNPSNIIYSGYNGYDSIPASPRLGWYRSDEGCYAIDVDGVSTKNAVVTAVIYDSNDRGNFIPVRTITLAKDALNYSKYLITEGNLSGLDLNKEYDTVFYFNGNMLGTVNREKLFVNNSEGYIPATGISLDQSTLSLTAGGTKTLTATVTPDDATEADHVTWSSSNTNVATVSNGVVTAVSAGTATITATVGSYSATCSVTVSAPSSGPIYIPVGTSTPDSSQTTDDKKPVVNADNSGKAQLTDKQLEKAESLTIQGESTLTFDKAAVEALKAINGDIAITVKKADIDKKEEIKTKIGDRPVYEFTVTAGGKEISSFNGGSVKVEIPYTPKKDEDLNAIVIYYIDANGNLNIVNNCVYDREKKALTFITTHFSTYAVGYNKTEFSDVSGWAADAITFLSARGIISGVGNGNYEPSNNIIRGDFAVILAKIAGADLDKYSTSRFTDVASTDRYSRAIEWAAENGIVSGVGEGKYAPTDSITRQDMAVMLTKLAKVMNYSLPQIKEKMNFADQTNISSYASSAVKAVQMAGIINGKTKAGENASYFAPQDNATRAEAAQMLATLIKGMLK